LAEAGDSVLFDCRLQLARAACQKFATSFEEHLVTAGQPESPGNTRVAVATEVMDK